MQPSFNVISYLIWTLLLCTKESGEALRRLQQQIHEAEKRMIRDDILGDDVLATGHENISKMKGRCTERLIVTNDWSLPLKRY